MNDYFEKISAYGEVDLPLPARATPGSAGFDLAAAEDIVIPPYDFLSTKIQDNVFLTSRHNDYYGFVKPFTLEEFADITKETKVRPTLVPTGMKCKLANNEYLAIVARSSLPLKHLLIVANAPGIIDSDYYNNNSNEGHIYIQLLNLSPFAIEIKRGDKIAQGIIMEYKGSGLTAENSVRAGGFGSTSA